MVSFFLIDLPYFICQIVYQVSDVVGVYHVQFQHLKVFCLCQNPKLLLISDIIQNQILNL